MALGQSAFTKIEASSGTSTSAALSRTPTAGNLIVVAATAFWSSGGTPVNLLAISGSTNGAYTKVGARVTADGTAGTDDTLGLFYHLNVAAVAETVTVTGGAGTAGVVGLLTELTGYTTVTVDVPGAPTTVANNASVISSALTNSQANAIYVCAVGCNAGGTVTLTPTGGFASSSNENNGASFPVIDLIYLVVSSAASRTATETITSSDWASCVAAFSDTPGGAQDTPELRGRPEGLRGANQMQQLLAA